MPKSGRWEEFEAVSILEIANINEATEKQEVTEEILN